jgi:septum formation protein
MADSAALYLASASPRRRELLRDLGYNFAVIAAPIDERALPGEKAEVLVERLARQKALAGLSLSQNHKLVLGSDTIVVVDSEVLGKPRDRDDCLRMLSLLSGRTHRVMTAIAIATPREVESLVVQTEVTMRSIAAQEQVAYWETGEPQDKAGSYGIQGIGGKFIARINGSYSGVVGLPLVETDILIQKHL